MSRALRVYTRVRELHVKGVSLITSATADHLLLRGQMAAETAKIGLTPALLRTQKLFRNTECNIPPLFATRSARRRRKDYAPFSGSRFQPPNIFRRLSKPAS